MTPTQIRRVIDKGFSVEVINTSTGIKERYTPTGTGMFACTYSGHDTCVSCGKPASLNKSELDVNKCKCEGRLKVVSITGAFRRIVELTGKGATEDVDHTSQKLTLRTIRRAVQ